MIEMAQTDRGDTACFKRIEADGVHELNESPFMRISCDEGNPHMICTLIARSEDAVHRP